MRWLVAAAALFMLAAGAGALTNTPADAQDARFQIERMGDTMLRLDKVTGAVDLCQTSAPAECEPLVPAEEVVSVAQDDELRAENARLTRRVAELERRLDAISRMAGAEGPAEIRPNPAMEGLLSADPEDAKREIDRALDVTGYAIKGLRELVRSLDTQ